ncbi:MAG: hypothetical protein CM15mP59_1440 [Flavobacteriaceae bacterium]|nr:MAG: hypothetical protein CM15mP59_1440 [Flavobacteriaceae bacterium]
MYKQQPKCTQTSLEQSEGKATIADADVVVSGGRGSKALKTGDSLRILPMYWEPLRLAQNLFRIWVGDPIANTWGKRENLSQQIST